MSMLAAPRRKQKVINLRAKNNAWSNDNTKFGQRMLEKMGWSSGKGLGAKENGMVDHVVARYKNDENGLGYEDRNDQWTKHEDDFNALLANLSNGDVEEEKLHSGVSLEDKSKKSKARVHYHKFTRGKDLTKYSEKDLANIFGKKSLKNVEKAEDETTKELEKREQIFTDKGSMEDYFKSKLAALKTKNKIPILENSANDDNEVDYSFRGFSGTNHEIETNGSPKETSFSFYGFQQSQTTKENELTASEHNVETVVNKKKKKNKYLNSQLDDSSVENEITNSEITEIHNIESEQPKKKKKKSKKDKLTANLEMESENSNEQITCNEEVPLPEKNKKSKKKKYQEPNEMENEPLSHIENSVENTENQGEDYHVPKKKKKRKNKDITE